MLKILVSATILAADQSLWEEIREAADTEELPTGSYHFRYTGDDDALEDEDENDSEDSEDNEEEYGTEYEMAEHDREEDAFEYGSADKDEYFEDL